MEVYSATSVRTIAATLRAGRVRATLHPQVIGRAHSLPAPVWLALLVEDGIAHLTRDTDVERVSSPVLVWRPWSPSHSVRLTPGSAATFLLLGPTLMVNALGDMRDTGRLRAVSERAVTLDLSDSASSLAALDACFLAICREVASESAMSLSVIEAYLRIVLIEVWRSQGPVHPRAGAVSPAQALFNRFTALVEQQFRARWTVEAYAEALGLSRDRLGDICRRVQGDSPKALIDRRTEREARLLLRNSALSIDQIAADLGFHSSGQFSRFVSRMTGHPPGRLRSQGAAPSEEGAAPIYEWP